MLAQFSETLAEDNFLTLSLAPSKKLDEWLFSTTLTGVIGVQRSCPLECKLDGPSRHQRRPVHLCAAQFTLLKLDSGGVECCDYWIGIL
jgi:hypothetical protein